MNFEEKFFNKLDKEITVLSKSIKRKLSKNERERMQAFNLLE